MLSTSPIKLCLVRIPLAVNRHWPELQNILKGLQLAHIVVT